MGFLRKEMFSIMTHGPPILTGNVVEKKAKCYKKKKMTLPMLKNLKFLIRLKNGDTHNLRNVI